MVHCDWCGERIDSQLYATLKPGGYYSDGEPIFMGQRTYHTSYVYGGELADQCCFAHALALLDGADFDSPDAGMRWKLVPASEVQNEVYNATYTEPTLGTTPLSELGLTEAAYKRITRRGIFTVEHLVDARARGADLGIPVKTLGRIDAALVDRGLLPVLDGVAP